MKKPITNILLSIVSCLCIASCGGSSGGSSDTGVADDSSQVNIIPLNAAERPLYTSNTVSYRSELLGSTGVDLSRFELQTSNFSTNFNETGTATGELDIRENTGSLAYLVDSENGTLIAPLYFSFDQLQSGLVEIDSIAILDSWILQLPILKLMTVEVRNSVLSYLKTLPDYISIAAQIESTFIQRSTAFTSSSVSGPILVRTAEFVYNALDAITRNQNVLSRNSVANKELPHLADNESLGPGEFLLKNPRYTFYEVGMSFSSSRFLVPGRSASFSIQDALSNITLIPSSGETDPGSRRITLPSTGDYGFTFKRSGFEPGTFGSMAGLANFTKAFCVVVDAIPSLMCPASNNSIAWFVETIARNDPEFVSRILPSISLLDALDIAYSEVDLINWLGTPDGQIYFEKMTSFFGSNAVKNLDPDGYTALLDKMRRFSKYAKNILTIYEATVSGLPFYVDLFTAAQGGNFCVRIRDGRIWESGDSFDCSGFSDPLPAISVSTTVRAGETVRFDASGTTDPFYDNADLYYSWDFDGDGDREVTFQNDPIVHHQYNSPGLYQATLWVMNPNGDVASTTIAITVTQDDSDTTGIPRDIYLEILQGDSRIALVPYLLTPSILGQSYELFMLASGGEGSLDTVPFASISGQTRISRSFDGVYHFKVYSLDRQPFSDTTVVVNVFIDGRLHRTIAPPENGRDTAVSFWNVLTIDGSTGEISVVNSFEN